MKLQTASATISFARNLEGKSAGSYQELSEKYDRDDDIFAAFAKENKKYVAQIERAYYETISDAIEGTFTFNIEPEAYEIKTTPGENASYSEALEGAIEVEETLARFYSDAAQQSKSLLADMPRIFMLIVRKRQDRIARLKALLAKEG